MKILFLLLLTSSSLLAQKAPTISQLVGTWKLVSVEDTMQDATLQPSKPFGPHPHGFIMYGPDGYMCATIVNGDRAPWTDPAKPTDAEKAAYYDTFRELNCYPLSRGRLDSGLCRLNPRRGLSSWKAISSSSHLQRESLIHRLKQRVLVWQRAK